MEEEGSGSWVRGLFEEFAGEGGGRLESSVPSCFGSVGRQAYVVRGEAGGSLRNTTSNRRARSTVVNAYDGSKKHLTTKTEPAAGAPGWYMRSAGSLAQPVR